MKMEIIEEPIVAAAELARVPIAFNVESVFDRFAYRELPDEVQLLWYKTLPQPGG